MRAMIFGLVKTASLATVLVASWPLSQAAKADDYPSRPVRLVIGIGAGGVADIMLRALTERMMVAMGQPFVLENVPGAGGNLAMDQVARAQPDGHTIAVIGPALVINPVLYKSMKFDPLQELIPIAPLAIAPFAVFASGTLPVKTISEFIAYAKARPGALNYASVGAGTAGHLSAVLFTEAAGLQMTHVPYRNIQSAAADLISGQVHIVFNAYPPLAPLLSDGKLKLLGFTTSERLKDFPEVPTLAETGLPGFEVSGWYVFLAPKGTPPQIVARLNAEITKGLGQSEVAATIRRSGFEPLPLSIAGTNKFVQVESEKWGKAVRSSGASVD